MTMHHDLKLFYGKAALAMHDNSNTVTLTLMRQQGDQVFMQTYESLPEGELPEAEAVFLHIIQHINVLDPCDSVALLLVPGNPERVMLNTNGELKSSDKN